MAIAEEVEKLFRAQFIEEVHYPDWLANVVLVKKSNGKWRMCVDFTDLNKACPKDSFPLPCWQLWNNMPRIDALVDSTSGYGLLSFMDAFSCYNQIYMHPEDREKTAFIIDRGLYYYKVMPFGLKNAGATYQRLVNKMFREQIGWNMEVYVDDMLVKSLTDKCLPFFKILRKAFEWSEECEEAFGELKKYLVNPRLLSRTIPREVLYLNLAVSLTAVSAALVREKEVVQKHVYFISRALKGAEERYPQMEKLAFALTIASRKLWPCFQAHTIRVLAKYPLKKALADFLAEFTNLPDAKQWLRDETWVVYVDGSSTRRHGGAGVIRITPKGEELRSSIRLEFRTTNNEAEYGP
ncbi:uncharacterized protein LOC132162283 [Corylus avellana]|uniref:uncharacterized protein LOC132162283 n=1 Tax=Corylus avellana TaxID=13451 RepID=UPI00286A2580|nr:uncharacterized protein LOC132162283 [Corylus avellana]